MATFKKHQREVRENLYIDYFFPTMNIHDLCVVCVFTTLP